MLQVATISRIPIYLHWSAVILVLLILFPTVSSLSIFLSVTVPIVVLLHELGHALMAQRFGIKVHSITLFGLGGMARMYSEGKTIGERLAIIAAGPVVNIALALAGLTLHAILLSAGLVRPENVFLISFWVSNLILGVFNLIPAFPMDGGRLLKTGLSRFVGQVKAIKIVTGLSLVLGVIAIAFGLFSFQLILIAIAVFVIYAANQERKRAGIKAFFQDRRKL